MFFSFVIDAFSRRVVGWQFASHMRTDLSSTRCAWPSPAATPARTGRAANVGRPSRDFHANGAWTVLAALAHALLRWTRLLGLPDTTVRAARTLRRRLLNIAGRLTRHTRGQTLHLPARWPWHGGYTRALNRIRALPAAA